MFPNNSNYQQSRASRDFLGILWHLACINLQFWDKWLATFCLDSRNLNLYFMKLVNFKGSMKEYLKSLIECNAGMWLFRQLFPLENTNFHIKPSVLIIIRKTNWVPFLYWPDSRWWRSWGRKRCCSRFLRLRWKLKR